MGMTLLPRNGTNPAHATTSLRFIAASHPVQRSSCPRLPESRKQNLITIPLLYSVIVGGGIAGDVNYAIEQRVRPGRRFCPHRTLLTQKHIVHGEAELDRVPLPGRQWRQTRVAKHRQ